MGRNSKLLTIFVLILFILIPLGVYFISVKQGVSEKEIINYVISLSPIKIPERESKIRRIVADNFNNDNNYSVVIKNFRTEEEYRFNSNQEYNSASLYKLWVLAVVQEKINNGSLDKNKLLVGDLNKFDETLSTSTPTPTPENQAEEQAAEEKEQKAISMRAEDAIEKMITFSDNYAALLLTQEVGSKSVVNFLKKYNFKNSSFGSPPKTTADDIASFYEKLYLGEIIDKTSSDEMLNILKRQTLNDRIPKYLPEDILVAHKTGELFGAKHDAGIVFSDNGDYMIVVLSDTDNASIAAEKTAKFSEDIFNYFKNEN